MVLSRLEKQTKAGGRPSHCRGRNKSQEQILSYTQWGIVMVVLWIPICWDAEAVRILHSLEVNMSEESSQSSLVYWTRVDDLLDLSHRDDAREHLLHLLTRERLRRVPHGAVGRHHSLWHHVVSIVASLDALRAGEIKGQLIFRNVLTGVLKTQISTAIFRNGLRFGNIALRWAFWQH